MSSVYNGLLNVYKEPGYTSNDVVAKLRGILHQRKIGAYIFYLEKKIMK